MANVVHLRQVERSLLNRYESIINLDDVKSAPPDQVEKIIRTRALAAEAIRLSAGITALEASACVTDGSMDNGVDALHISPLKVRIVQSKWHSNATGSIGKSEMQAVRQGFVDLCDGRLSRFNEKFNQFHQEIERAISDSDVKFEIIVITSGSARLAVEPQAIVDDILAEYNEGEHFVDIETWGLDELRRKIADERNGKTVDLLGVTIENYGQITEPYLAFYGVVDGIAVKDWHDKHGDLLFDQNIRKSLGSTPVNDALADTIVDNPEKFWYFNNGITILCESLKRRPRGASTRNYGEFDLRGASIVNGAQTVASISGALSSQPEEDAPSPKVWVRAISLEGCPEDFAAEVTRATNTQNTVENRDFASLDREQDRLRDDFRLSLDKIYAYRRGEKEPSSSEGCTLTDAAISLACLSQDISLAVIAKSAPGRLWDTQGRYYKQLFNPGTNAFTVWRSVQTMRYVEEILSDRWPSTPEGRGRLVLRQGNRIILWAVWRRIDMSGLADPDFDWSEKWDSVLDETEKVYSDLYSAVEELYPTNYITSLFKNAGRCRSLAPRIT